MPNPHPTPESAETSATETRETMIRLIEQSIHFVLWAVEEGIGPADGGPGQPEDILISYTEATGDKEWETLAPRVAADLRASLSPATVPGEVVELRGELELLEEVCAFYADDEDRFLREEGEPYGSVPIEVGMKARSARRRFRAREAALAKAEASLATSRTEPGRE